MKPLVLTLLAAAAVTGAAQAAEPLTQDPHAVLRAMSGKLAASKEFSFTAVREIDAALSHSGDLPEKAKVTLHVSRPGRLASRSVTSGRTMRLVADGTTLTLLNETQNHYAQVPVPATIDALIDRLEAEYGFVPPLADFAVSNPEKEMLRHARTVKYLGTTTLRTGFLGLGRLECHRIGLSGPIADAELLISKKDNLPRQLTATFRQAGEGAAPALRVTFLQWKLDSPAPAGTFTFTPPSGADRIEMWTSARMRAAAANN